MKIFVILMFILTISLNTFSQDVQKTEVKPQTQAYSYAYIIVQGKSFSKKLHVEVDFGDTQEQINSGKEYSETLTNKKSYAAILNYMGEREFELVESRDYSFTYQGTGGTYGIIFIMKKKK